MNDNSTPATVLYLDYTNQIGLGGAQRSLSLLVRYLDRRRFRAVVACPPGERLTQLMPDDTPIFEIPLGEGFSAVSRYESPWGRLPTALISCRKAVREIQEIVRRERVTLIHANNLKMCWLAAMSVGRKLPIIWHVRDIYPSSRFVQVSTRVAGGMATRIVTVSGAVRDQFADHSKITVIHNAVELPDMGAGAKAGQRFRQQHGIPQTAVVVGSAGRLAPWKGNDRLIEAAAQLVPDIPNLQFAIVGEGPEEPLLKSMVRSLGLEGRVHLIPFQSNMAAVWSATDLVAVPSVEPDPFPRSVIEAMSFGKAVIGSRDGGIIEAIEDGITGYLADPGSVGDLTTKLRAVLDQPGEIARLGQNARARCEQLFSVEAQAEAVASLYSALIERAAAAQAA